MLPDERPRLRARILGAREMERWENSMWVLHPRWLTDEIDRNRVGVPVDCGCGGSAAAAAAAVAFLNGLLRFSKISEMVAASEELQR